MHARFLIVPQWQGSPSARAMRVAEGATIIAGDLPASATTTIAVPLEAGDDEGTLIHRHSSIRLARERTAIELASAESTPILVGGDCGITVAGVEHAARHAAGRGERLGLVWFDAHADLNSAMTSPSGAFAGMALRTVIDEGLVGADAVVIVGARAWDAAELDYATEHGIRSLGTHELTPDALLAAVDALGVDRVYLHIDLDVIDPGEFTGVALPEPFGVEGPALVDTIRALRARHELAGASIAGFAPADADAAVSDLPTILRIIGALTAGGRTLAA